MAVDTGREDGAAAFVIGVFGGDFQALAGSSSSANSRLPGGQVADLLCYVFHVL
jgi:hypothetical protein